MVRPTPDEREKLIEVLTDEDQARVHAGDITVWHPPEPGGYPVLRYASGNSEGKHAGMIAKGSGKHAGSLTYGETGRRTAYKQSKEYRALMERYVPEEKFLWLLDKGFEAVDGTPINVKAACPVCDHKFSVEAYRKTDSVVFKELMQQLLGQPKRTEEVDVNIQQLIAQIDARPDSNMIEVYDLPDEVIERRKRELEGLDADQGAPVEAVGTSGVQA